MASMNDKVGEARLRCFRYVKRKCTNVPVWKCERLAMDGFRRGKDRLKKYLTDVIRQDITQLQLTEDMTLDGRL